MKAYLIDADQKTVSPVEIAGLDDVKKLIGYDSVDSDEMDASGDRLYFDESCFLRDQAGKGRFKLDNLAPVAGKGVVAGSSGDTLQDAAVENAALLLRVTWL
ncbi:MAG: hypothetical protein ABL877_10545 [Thiobacillus sp.]